MRILLPAILSVLLSGSLGASRQDDESAEELSEQITQLESGLEQVAKELRAEYEALEDLYTNEGRQEALVPAIVAALRQGSLPPVGADRGGRSLAAFRRAIHRALEELDALSPLIIPELAKELSVSFRPSGDEEPPLEFWQDWVRRGLDGTFTDKPFHERWNEGLFELSSAAQKWREAHDRIDELRTRVDKLLNPSAGDPDAPDGMMRIPGGSYDVGPNGGWERKQKRVVLRSYFIDVYEVTNRQYKEFWDQLDEDEQVAHRPRYWIRASGGWDVPNGRLDHPVTGVSWSAAAAYAEWAGKRLPTEDEWEVAARGVAARRFPWGDSFDPKRCNSSTSAIEDTVVVGTYPGGASPFGCQDMAGNVEEWTASLRDGKVLKRDPRLLRDQVVVRGGGYQSRAEELATNWRWVYPPGTTQPYLGFRCVRDAR
ncbi:MAG: SUMF1/EgtB/PvdO family nonheme iron enzyme [Planctomycetota bacterium]